MSYSTPVMVRKALLPSSDGTQPSPPSHTAADLSDAELQDAINEADSTIDGALSGIYATPVANDGSGNVPHPIDYWSRNLAAYIATLSYRGSSDIADQDPVVRRYKMTQDAINMVATNKASLTLPRNTGPSSQVGVGSAYNPYVGDLWDPQDFSLVPGTSPGLNSPGRYWDPWYSDRNP